MQGAWRENRARQEKSRGEKQEKQRQLHGAVHKPKSKAAARAEHTEEVMAEEGIICVEVSPKPAESNNGRKRGVDDNDAGVWLLHKCRDVTEGCWWQ